MEEALAKIRPHTSSSLAHQKTPATLLVALEATFQEQSTDSTPTAYFATLLTTLDGTIQKISSGSDESELLYAELYLLALIIPFVPAPVIRTNLSTTSQLTAPLFRTLHPQAPALRSQLTIYDHVFRALDRSQLDAPNLRQCFASVLELCVDPRPKVRKKAAELVKDVLASPPAPLSRHPYAERVSTWVNKVLTEVGTGPRVGQSKGGKQSDTGSETAIHVIAFLRPVLVHLPATALPSVTSLLLTLPRLGNPYLSQSVYNLLSDLLTHLEDDDNFTCGGVAEVLNVILSSSPTKSDTILSPAWVQLVGHAFFIYKTDDQQSYSSELMKVWKTVWDFLDSANAPTRQAAAESLGMLCGCFNKEIINDALQQQQTNHGLNKIVTQISKAFDSLAYARAMPELLSLISSALRGLKYRPTPASGAAAEVLLLPLVTKIGETRVQKGFEFKESADATLGVAMEVLGPEVLLKALPLNLEPADRKAGKEPRAFLLPLLPHPHPSPLSHFVSYFVPMSERMFDLQSTAEAEGRQSEAKVWSVLISQIWSGLVGYCHVTPDLPQGLTASFAQLLSQLLYSQPELRPAVLRALKVMVESNVAVTNPPLEDTPVWDPVYITVAVKNLEFLRSQVESWLAVFFNVFDATDKDARRQVGDVISVWASIAGEEAISKAYAKVLGLFKGAVNGMAKEGQAGAQAHVVATTQDILLVLLPYLSASDSSALFQICLSSEILLAKDNAIQKRGYKILTKLAKAGKFALEAEAVFRQLDELSDGMAAAAKKDRFNLIALLVPFLSSSQLYIIPSLIPEAVLGTKEPSDKARTAAFELILAIASRMNQGGIIKSSLIDGMDEDNASDRTASLEEFVTMLAGGLAASPHMISATVTAISRIVFEYKDTISTKMHNEIFTTLLVFVTSNNREIVKSVLGYVKLAIHTLPIEVVKPHLHELVPALLTWSHDHKNHFKAKVRHVFERMIRRFGWEDVDTCAQGEDASKVLVNIKKRKDRAKRKKQAKAGEEDEDEDEQLANKPRTGDAFEDVLYGSESEDEGSEEEEEQPAKVVKRKGGKDFGPRLRMDEDEPMDLLHGASSRIMTSDNQRRRKPGQDASRFKTDENTGKMIIDDGAASDNEEAAAAAAVDEAGAAYKETLTSVDGFTRGPNGRVKFHKDTKKRRREAEDDMDVDMGDSTASGKHKKANKKDEPRVGHEFKAKKAGGDVKKNGVDPYAYLSLSEAAGKKGGRGKRQKIGIVGKR